MLKKISILGAECSGKSTLTKKLALQYKGIAVFEYLRYYCNIYSIPNNIEQQIYIAKKQIELEHIAVFTALNGSNHISKPKLPKFIFCDTSPLLTYIYTLYYFNIDNLILKNLALYHHLTYQKTLLLAPLEWVADGQRDSPQAQHDIYILLLNKLNEFNIKFEYI